MMNALAEFFSPEAGQARRQWLNRQEDRVGNALAGYLGPAAQPIQSAALLAGYLSPGADMMEAADASRGMWNADNPLDAAVAGATMLGATGMMFLPGNFNALQEGVGSVADDLVRAYDPSRVNAITAYHGSPHTFDRFSLDHIGTGEGKQAEGFGLYFAESPRVAERYRDFTADRIGDGRPGNVYEVRINADPSEMVDWNSPLSGQPERVREWFAGRGITEGFAGNQPGVSLMMAERGAMGDQALAHSMREAGIPGIKYLDAGSREAAEGSRNFVIFDDSIVDILKRYGIGAAAVGGGWALAPEEAQAAQSAGLFDPAANDRQVILDWLDSQGL